MAKKIGQKSLFIKVFTGLTLEIAPIRKARCVLFGQGA
jgi:hypothetical protein